MEKENHAIPETMDEAIDIYVMVGKASQNEFVKVHFRAEKSDA